MNGYEPKVGHQVKAYTESVGKVTDVRETSVDIDTGNGVETFDRDHWYFERIPDPEPKWEMGTVISVHNTTGTHVMVRTDARFLPLGHRWACSCGYSHTWDWVSEKWALNLVTILVLDAEPVTS